MQTGDGSRPRSFPAETDDCRQDHAPRRDPCRTERFGAAWRWRRRVAVDAVGEDGGEVELHSADDDPGAAGYAAICRRTAAAPAVQDLILGEVSAAQIE